MTANRLPYETSAGDLAASDTYKQLLEYLRLVEEDLLTLSIIAKREKNDSLASQWKHIATNFNQVQQIINHLNTKRSTSGVGYDPTSAN